MNVGFRHSEPWVLAPAVPNGSYQQPPTFGSRGPPRRDRRIELRYHGYGGKMDGMEIATASNGLPPT